MMSNILLLWYLGIMALSFAGTIVIINYNANKERKDIERRLKQLMIRLKLRRRR